MSRSISGLDCKEFYSRDGYLVNFFGDRWRLNKDITICMGSIEEFLGEAQEGCFRAVLAEYAKYASASYALNIFYAFKWYLKKTVGLEPFSVESLLSYRSTFNSDDQQQLSVVRGFIRKWSRLGYPGIPVETCRLFDNWVLKGNPKGNNVLLMCPNKGPLTDIEMQGVGSALISAYASGRLNVSDCCCAMIVMMTGRRPSQIAALKFRDIYYDGSRYWIYFPRAKQRGLKWRGQFNKFAITEDLWLIIQEQLEFVAKSYSALVGREISDEMTDDLPIFPVDLKAANVEGFYEKLDGDYFHVPVRGLRDKIEFVSRSLGVISERTGHKMCLNSRRFRYTLGTNLAREGSGVYIIAEALDHSDTQNAGIYVKNVPDIVKRLDKAVALQLAPIAQAFQGVLIASETEARRGGDPSSRISNGRAYVGSCGSYGFCGALAPIACYTCAHFQPWIDGAHEEVLDRLIGERDRVQEQTGDLKIASANDRLILAVGDVIHRCRMAKEGMTNG